MGTAGERAVRPWQEAWEDCDFYHHHQPAAHFDTSVTMSDHVADELTLVLHSVRQRLEGDAPISVVDVGAGGGQLLTAMWQQVMTTDVVFAESVHWIGIDIRSRPLGLPTSIEWWRGDAPGVLETHAPNGLRGLILAHEWLDDIACPVVQADEGERIREVWVDPVTGAESLGPELEPESPQLQWLQKWWWPVRGRAEVGESRDLAWQRVCARLIEGTAIAIDYGHTFEERVNGDFAAGTLAAYRGGHQVRPIPDGSCNITAHVALDACAAMVGSGAQNTATTITRQRDVLHGDLLPSAGRSVIDPRRYLAELGRANKALGVRRDHGPGSFMWLRHDIGGPLRGRDL